MGEWQQYRHVNSLQSNFILIYVHDFDFKTLYFPETVLYKYLTQEKPS